MPVDTSAWSGDGAFTQALIDAIDAIGEVAFLRVEDAPATRADVGYQLISNEIYVAFRTRSVRRRVRRFGFWPASMTVEEPCLALADLERTLSGVEEVGVADYGDDGMLQYLKTERVVPPYQTRGYKLVELVRVYDVTSEAPRTDQDRP